MPAASAPSRSVVHDVPERERRGGRRSRGIKEFSCETCGKVAIFPQPFLFFPYLLLTLMASPNPGLSPSKLPRQAPLGTQPLLD